MRLIDTPKRSPRTIGLYRSVARLRLASLARVPVAEVTTARLRGLLAEWEREGLSVASRQLGYQVLAGVCDLLVDAGDMRSSPLRGVPRPTGPRSSAVTWTPIEVRAFLGTQTDAPYGHAWELMFAGLLRIGELCALRWDDLEGGVLTVRRTWTRDTAEHAVIGTTGKSAAALRRIPLAPALVERLAALQTRQGGAWVIADRAGEPLPPTGLRKRWNAAVSASGLPRITPHGARHSGATALIAAGVPVSAVQKLLGHTDAAFTLRRYVHAGEAETRAAAAALETLFGVQSAPNVVTLDEKRRNRGDNSGVG